MGVLGDESLNVTFFAKDLRVGDLSEDFFGVRTFVLREFGFDLDLDGLGSNAERWRKKIIWKMKFEMKKRE